MAVIPAHEFDMTVTFSVRECGLYDVPGAAYPGLNYENLHRPWSLTRRVKLSPYAIDRTPVTNAQFARFLADSGYAPEIS